MKAKALLEKRSYEVGDAIAQARASLKRARTPLAGVVRDFRRAEKKLRKAVEKYNRLAEKHGHELESWKVPATQDLLNCLLSCLDDADRELQGLRVQVMSRHP